MYHMEQCLHHFALPVVPLNDNTNNDTTCDICNHLFSSQLVSCVFWFTSTKFKERHAFTSSCGYTSSENHLRKKWHNLQFDASVSHDSFVNFFFSFLWMLVNQLRLNLNARNYLEPSSEEQQWKMSEQAEESMSLDNRMLMTTPSSACSGTSSESALMLYLVYIIIWMSLVYNLRFGCERFRKENPTKSW